MLKIAVLVAMPTANINTTTMVKPRSFASVRTLVRRSRTKFSIVRFPPPIFISERISRVHSYRTARFFAPLASATVTGDRLDTLPFVVGDRHHREARYPDQRE